MYITERSYMLITSGSLRETRLAFNFELGGFDSISRWSQLHRLRSVLPQALQYLCLLSFVFLLLCQGRGGGGVREGGGKG